MTTFTATSVVTGSANRPEKTLATGRCDVVYSVALPNTLALNDTILGPTLPAGYYLLDVVLDADDLDTNGAPTITLDAGYAGQAQAFIAASTVAQAGGRQSANKAGVVGFTAATDTQLVVTVHAAAATPQAGKLRMLLTYARDV